MEQEVTQSLPPESRELIPPTPVLWFAGALEAGGTIGFAVNRSIKGDRIIIRSNVFLVVRGINEALADQLCREFGINKTRPTVKWQFRLNGRRAAETIAELEPYVVSRKEVALAAKNWLQSDNEGQVQIAEEMTGYNRYNTGSPEDYQNLVRNPIFVAGVLDNRASIYPFTEKGYVYPRVATQSLNKVLLDALQNQYGGKVVKVIEQGRKQIVQGRTIEAKRDSYRWIVGTAAARSLLGLVSPHLKIPPYEGWNRQQIEVARQGRSDQATQIIDSVTAELRRYQAGEITRLSTTAEIGNQFSISNPTVRRRLKELPDDLRKLRRRIINTVNATIH